MVSVTRENIKELLPEIEASIADSFFVAIDTEFSGLNLGLEESRESRFDSAEQRYTRLRKNVKEASLLQLGITCFFNGPLGESTDAEENGEIGYRATCYNVVLAPADTGLLEFEAKPLAAEWGAMRFLRSHNFDLNQVVSVGVPHMKAMDIDHFAQRISRGTAALQHNDIDKDSLRQAESEVQQLQRIIDADAGKTTEFVFENLKCAPYIVHALLREVQPEMWTIPLTWNSLKAVVVNPAKRAELEQTDRTLEEWVVQESTIGGRIFAKLVEERKAIVGFQLLSDMLFLIDTFYGELPKSYTGFKALIGDLFPNMYDGKTITQMLSRHERINTFGHFDSPSLLELYSTLTTPRTSGMFAHAPLFQLDIRHTHYGCETHAHEAAFDAFMSGVVFVHAIFALSADKLAEARALAAHTTTHPFDLTRESNQGGSAPPPAGNARRVMRDGSSTCHALPPLVLRQVPQDIETVLAYRGLLYIHMCADKCLNIFGDDEQANRSKAWVRLFSTDGEVPVAESPLVKAFLAALAYEHYVKSPMEIVIACTTSDRAAKIAEYARRGLSVKAEIFDSAVSKRLISPMPTSHYGTMMLGVFFLSNLFGIAWYSLLRSK